jgi:hypothetical protein
MKAGGSILFIFFALSFLAGPPPFTTHAVYFFVCAVPTLFSHGTTSFLQNERKRLFTGIVYLELWACVSSSS